MAAKVLRRPDALQIDCSRKDMGKCFSIIKEVQSQDRADQTGDPDRSEQSAAQLPSGRSQQFAERELVQQAMANVNDLLSKSEPVSSAAHTCTPWGQASHCKFSYLMASKPKLWQGIPETASQPDLRQRHGKGM